MKIGNYTFEHCSDGMRFSYGPFIDEWDTTDSTKLYQMVVGALPETSKPKFTKEFNMNNVYVTVDGKTYKTSGGVMRIPACGEYCEINVESIMAPFNEVNLLPSIKDVIFNPPATIVFWSDDTKTVVRAQGDDIYDPEKGIAMAISKKLLGNKYDYYHTFQCYLKKWNKQQEDNSMEV